MEHEARNSMKAIIFFAAVVSLLLLIVSSAWSEYPERPITILVGSTAGGGTDLGVRALAIGAERNLGKRLMIENRGGAGGTVALSQVAVAKPDGYTLGCAVNGSIVDTPLMQHVTFKPLKSFTPIISYAIGQHTGLLVKSDAPWKTFKEFLDYVRENPGKIKYSSAGIGYSVHINMEAIGKKEGLKWVHVPYKGNAPAVMALLGGHVDACSCDTSFPQHVEAGSARVLLTHGATRDPKFPDVPTAMELGYGVKSETIHSIVGPAGIPDEIVVKLEAAFKMGMETQEFKSMLAISNKDPYYMGSKDYERYLKEYWTRSESLLTDLGLIKEPATQPY